MTEEAPAVAGVFDALGTMLFAASKTVEFVLEPETWPVFVAWYKAHHDRTGAMGQHEAALRAELVDILGTMQTMTVLAEMTG